MQCTSYSQVTKRDTSNQKEARSCSRCNHNVKIRSALNTSSALTIDQGDPGLMLVLACSVLSTARLADASADSHHFIEPPIVRAPKEISLIVSVIDKTIVRDIPSIGTLAKESPQMIKRPRQFFGALSFRLTVAVYFGTHAVANLSELALDENKVAKEERRKKIKVSCAASANIGLLSWRDSIFSREFSGATIGSTPKVTPVSMIVSAAARK